MLPTIIMICIVANKLVYIFSCAVCGLGPPLHVAAKLAPMSCILSWHQHLQINELVQDK